MIRVDPIEYKKRSITIWDEVAPRYHKKRASKNKGPFKSSSKLLKLIKVKPSYLVLDLACGTGIITEKISRKIGSLGHVVGIDTSFNAIKIAKKWINKNNNVDFVVCDAEKISFKKKFDAITCQYALFSFQIHKKRYVMQKSPSRKMV